MLTAPLPFKHVSFAFFFHVGLCSRGFSFAGDVAAPQALDLIARRRSRGLESMRSSIKARAQIYFKLLRSRAYRGDTWLREETSIFIGRLWSIAKLMHLGAASRLTSTLRSSSDGYDASRSWCIEERQRGLISTQRWRSNGGNFAIARSQQDWTAEIWWSWQSWPTINVWSWSDCHAIVARSPCDHGHDRLNLMAHDHRVIMAINSTSPLHQTTRIFWAKISFKNDVFPLVFLNSWLIREAIKWIWSKILSSSWFPCI